MLILLKYKTSKAKMAPANGVPKTEAKPALIPRMMSVFLSELSSLKISENWSAIAPPICTAVPSRPAEPPKRWVINVLRSTIGAILKRNGFLWIFVFFQQQVVAFHDRFSILMVEPSYVESAYWQQPNNPIVVFPKLGDPFQCHQKKMPKQNRKKSPSKHKWKSIWVRERLCFLGSFGLVFVIATKENSHLLLSLCDFSRWSKWQT